MQRPQGESRVTHPGVAVVPVALAARGLGQRRRERRHRGPRRRVGETLDGERRPLECLPVAMVDRRRPPQPRPPEAGGGVQACVRLTDVARYGPAPVPRQDAVGLVAPAEHVVSPNPAALDAQRHVGPQLDGLTRPCGIGDVTLPVCHRPRRRGAAVVEHRLAHQLDLHVTVDALGHPHQGVVGVDVGQRPRVRCDLVLPPPGPHGQRGRVRPSSRSAWPTSWTGCSCRIRRPASSAR